MGTYSCKKLPEKTNSIAAEVIDRHRSLECVSIKTPKVMARLLTNTKVSTKQKLLIDTKFNVPTKNQIILVKQFFNSKFSS